jgi:hypothetical protein
MATHKHIYDHNGTVVRVLHTEDRGDGFDTDFAIETIEDVEPLLDEVKDLRGVQTSSADMRHVARVPVTVVEKAMREGWFHDDAAWNRFLNDPDNAGFRVWQGRL